MSEQMTPQLAKLIVLKMAQSDTERWDAVIDSTKTLDEKERLLIRTAIRNYSAQLADNIRYQETVAHERF